MFFPLRSGDIVQHASGDKYIVTDVYIEGEGVNIKAAKMSSDTIDLAFEDIQLCDINKTQRKKSVQPHKIKSSGLIWRGDKKETEKAKAILEQIVEEATEYKETSSVNSTIKSHDGLTRVLTLWKDLKLVARYAKSLDLVNSFEPSVNKDYVAQHKHADIFEKYIDAAISLQNKVKI